MKHITLPTLLVTVAASSTALPAYAVDAWKAGRETSQCHVHAASTGGHYDLRFDVRRDAPEMLVQVTRTDGVSFDRQTFNVNLKTFYEYAHPDDPARAAFGSYEILVRFTRLDDRKAASAKLSFDDATKWLLSRVNSNHVSLTFDNGWSAGFDMRESWRGFNTWYECVRKLTGVEIDRPRASVPSRAAR